MTENRIYSEQLRQAYDHIAEADSTVRSALLVPTADQLAAAEKARTDLDNALKLLGSITTP